MSMKTGRNLILIIQTVVKVLILAVFFIFMAYPLIWLAYSSLKPLQEIYDSVFALPKSLNISNSFIYEQENFQRYYINSLIVSSVQHWG